MSFTRSGIVFIQYGTTNPYACREKSEVKIRRRLRVKMRSQSRDSLSLPSAPQYLPRYKAIKKTKQSFLPLSSTLIHVKIPNLLSIPSLPPSSAPEAPDNNPRPRHGPQKTHNARPTSSSTPLQCELQGKPDPDRTVSPKANTRSYDNSVPYVSLSHI